MVKRIPISVALLSLGLGVGPAWAAGVEGSGATKTRLPNIIFLFADDLGYGDLACYGHPYARTPNLDRLAAEGTRFTQFYVTGITCNPSRTGFMTSKFPATFAKYPADSGFGDRVTVTELLKKRGYATGHFGKWHLGPESKPGTYGIDRIAASDDDGPRRLQAGGRDAGVYTAAIEFIREHRDRPFYLNVWGHITHFPVNPAPTFSKRFDRLAVKEADFGAAMREKFAQVRGLGGDVDAAMRNYLGDVSSLDDDIGRLLAVVDDLGLREHTLVVFSSDHGPAPVTSGNSDKGDKEEKRASLKVNMLGSPGPFRGGKHTMLEGGVRVPFLLRWPGRVSAGRVDSESVISGIDWLPTLCALTGTEIDPNGFDGEDVSAAWLGTAVHRRTKPLFWRVSNPGAAIGIRSGSWKLYDPQERRRIPLELYDVVADPGETKNLAEIHPEVVRDLRQQIATWAATLPTDYAKIKDKLD